MSDNYQLITEKDPKTYMDGETFQPYYKVGITLKVLLNAQHDGRLWKEREVRLAENELIERIMNKLRVTVTDLVTHSNPYSIHGH